MEDGKQRSKKEDAERKEGYKKSDRERATERHRDKDREKDADKPKDREIEKKDRDNRRLDKDRSLDKYRDSRDSRHRDSREKEKESRSRHRDDREKIKDREEDSREKLREKIKDRDRDDPSKSERKRRDSERVRDSDSDEDWDRKRRKREDSVRERDRNRVDRIRDDEDAGGSARVRDRERERNRHRHKDDEDGGTARNRDRERERSKGDRHRDEEEEGKVRKNVDGKRRKNEDVDEEVNHKGKKDFAEEDMEEEQRKLDEEIEKRRRRVQEWQELKRNKEESEKEKRGEDKGEPEAKAGKKWTLEGEESDDDDDVIPDANANEDVHGSENGYALISDSEDKNVQDGKAMKIDKSDANVEDEVDPLDAFMNTLVLPDMKNLKGTAEKSLPSKGNRNETEGLGFQAKRTMKNKVGRIIPGEDSDIDNEEGGDYDEDKTDDENDDEFMKRVKKTKVEKLSIVDHSKVQYAPFRKDFYREVRENSLMTLEEVALYRKQLELKIRGKDIPKPVKTWNQTGLTRNVLEVIKKLGFEKPMSIQAQALPVIMSGRDCIGVAKTGSGKTLAFVLPMLRHIKDQPPLDTGDGPIGLIMAPTRELVQQIHADIKKIAKVLGLNCVPVYGGSAKALPYLNLINPYLSCIRNPCGKNPSCRCWIRPKAVMSSRLFLLRTFARARAFSTTSSTFTAHSSSPALLPKSSSALLPKSSSPVLSGYDHLLGFNRPSLLSRCTIVRCRVSNSGSVYSPLDSNDSGRREPLFPGCDYEHWLVTMEFPDPQTTREQKIETFVKTLANVVGSEEEAKKRIYALSTTTYTGFMCEISEELSEKIKKEPGVEWVLPDSYADPLKKEYGVGDKYINGVIIPDTRVYNRPTGRDRPRNRRRDSMPIERRDVPTSRVPLPTLGGRDTVQGNSVQGDQRDFRPTESRDNMQGGQGVYRPMDGRAPMAGDRPDYRPPLDARGPLPGDRQDYRPPVDARGPLPGDRQDYRPPVDARGPMSGYRQDYRPPVDARGSTPGYQQDYRPPMDARGPTPGYQQDYRPPVDARAPMPGYQQDYRPPVDTRGPLPGNQQSYRPPSDGRGPMSGVPQDYRSPVDARGPMPVSGDRQDYRPPVDSRGPMPGGQPDYRPSMEGRGWMPGQQQDYIPPVEGGGSVSGESRDYMPSREPTQGQQ